MLSADRRLQKSSRALGMAVSFGRAEEALYRVESGRLATDRDRHCLAPVADLLADARSGLVWIDAVASGQAPSAVSTQQLRAVQLVVPALPEGQDATSALAAITVTAMKLSEGESTSEDERKVLALTLERLGAYASAEGVDALESRPNLPALSALPK
jgi:hypothetical protein